jgi:hypothetical protein
MIKHIVMWKLKEYAAGNSRVQNAQKIKKELESLAPKIPQIKRLEVGLNIVSSDAAYDAALYSEFASLQDLETYLKHPEHTKIADFIGSVREGRAVVDYEIPA